MFTLEELKKNWIFILGIVFLFFATIYGLSVAFEENLIPEEAKIGFGLFLSLTICFIGFKLFSNQIELIGEIISGFGVSILFATFAYASFVSHIQWSSYTLFVSLAAVSATLIYFSYRFGMRILMNICLTGGLITPLIINAVPSQTVLLFVYVFILNITSLYLSFLKKWPETRAVSLFITILIFLTYYIKFSPVSWPEPFFYVSILFLIYLIGLLVSAKLEKEKFDGISLYISVLNILNYVIWTIYIFNAFTLVYSIPLIILSFILIGTAALLHFFLKESNLSAIVYLVVGYLLLGISFGNIADSYQDKGMNYVIVTTGWLFIISSVYLFGKRIKQQQLMLGSIYLFVVLLVYWYANAWSVEWIEIFGFKYIPFLNPGALVWILIASVSFYIAKVGTGELADEKHEILTLPGVIWELSFSIIGHLVVGGLLTVQIQNLWLAYEFTSIQPDMVLSISWTIYSLMLFLWGAYTKNTAFRAFGSIVLILVSLKVFFFDLADQSKAYKAVFFLILAVLVISIAYVNQRWTSQETKEKPKI
ncbi:hypothetical protein LPTSP3_g32400 [Leptospira kobayashii]|uniref:DUF2339 domain-containing protein n=1 Tax=Leptospira kobayashii TaxID=1917830 RepID=A0ABM7USQ4_9LEPT|nr:DUF2339 domain-containing protein [Leptospira kobayashii]BDA80310.1 hypothetical protein LPTSP3_g32400 [Leptospira kobayashii]